MSDVNIHANGSWLGDATEEFKKLPPWGKGLAILAVVGVAGIGFYEYRKNSVASVGSQLATTGGIAGGTADSGGSQSPFGSITSGNSSVPLLPPGVTPIFGPGGDLIGFQNPPTPVPTSTPAPTSTPKPTTPPPPAATAHPIIGKPVTTPSTPTQPKPMPKLQYYTVQHGDSLSLIANKLHIRGGWQALYNANGNRAVVGNNPNLIYSGQKLNVTGLV